MSKQIEALKKLGLTDTEIAEVLEADKKIDKGEKLFELSAEKEKSSKEARSVARKPTVYKLDNAKGKRSKKADNQKNEILKSIIEAVEKFADNGSVETINPEREFVFTENGKKFKIVLSCPRS